MIPLSVLDLSPIIEGGTAAQSHRNTLDLAQNAERCGYTRFWLAEHHNMPGIGRAATRVLLAYVGAGTSTIRVGAGGIMLPNHTLAGDGAVRHARVFPGRVDLGLGRAPGTDPAAARPLRRTLNSNPDEFPRDVLESWRSCARRSPVSRRVPCPAPGCDASARRSVGELPAARTACSARRVSGVRGRVTPPSTNRP